MKFAPLLLALPLAAGCVVHTRPPPEEPPPTTVYADPEPAPSGARWEVLGTLSVDGRNDRDTLEVGRREGRFAALRLRVHNSALRMHNVVVVFEDGSSYSPDTRLVFDAGTTSHIIDLPGGRRAIRRVMFRYSDVAGGGRAVVEVLAR